MTEQTLSSVNRLTPAGYRDTKSNGVSVVCRLFVMSYCFKDESYCGRVGTIASKRTFPRAVDRNRARRLLRTAYRLSRDKIAVPVDMVLIARRRILEHKSQDVVLELAKICRKAGIWKGAT